MRPPLAAALLLASSWTFAEAPAPKDVKIVDRIVFRTEVEPQFDAAKVRPTMTALEGEWKKVLTLSGHSGRYYTLGMDETLDFTVRDNKDVPFAKPKKTLIARQSNSNYLDQGAVTFDKRTASFIGDTDSRWACRLLASGELLCRVTSYAVVDGKTTVALSQLFGYVRQPKKALPETVWYKCRSYGCP